MVDKSVVAKLKKGNKTYEILVDSRLAHDFKNGKSVSISNVVVTEEIFYDVKKGIRASEHELKNLFNTDDKLEICKSIILHGNVPMTADMKRDELEMKKRQVVNIIHKNVVDPHTGKPHPISRIEASIEEAKVKIDEYKTAEQQVQEIITQIRRIIPIKLEIRELEVRIPGHYAGRLQSQIRHFGKVLKESWENDGSYLAIVEIPAGIQEEFEIDLNRIAKGTVEVRVKNTR